ncbi:hypothetical protein N234_08310 [Ralstonia pickettii DTP0602]|nr:hypothetical protein N234_08310 [Ralstonia pickettii DTP0602]
MKITIRAEVTTDYGEIATFEVCKIDRPYRELEPAKVGLSLAEGKDVLHELQKIMVAMQAEEVCMLRRFCTRCHSFLDLKDRRIRKVDTVFGTVPFRSARIICCPCGTPLPLEFPYSPMTEYVPERATSELLALEAKLSAQMPYRQVETEKAARRVLISRIDKLRWCFWHAQLEKAKNRMQGILTICRVIVPETPGVADSLAQLDYRARELVAYVDANGGATINYGARHRQDKPISTARAESAVNQVLNKRMCKRQQMRWSPNGVHLLAQVRCAVINGDLVERLARYEPPTEPRSREVVEFLEQLGLSQFKPQGF